MVISSPRAIADHVTIEEFRADQAKELITMWRESFESGVGIEDFHPIAEQEKWIVARGFEPMWKLNDLKYQWISS